MREIKNLIYLYLFKIKIIDIAIVKWNFIDLMPEEEKIWGVVCWVTHIGEESIPEIWSNYLRKYPSKPTRIGPMLPSTSSF